MLGTGRHRGRPDPRTWRRRPQQAQPPTRGCSPPLGLGHRTEPGCAGAPGPLFGRNRTPATAPPARAGSGWSMTASSASSFPSAAQFAALLRFATGPWPFPSLPRPPLITLAATTASGSLQAASGTGPWAPRPTPRGKASARPAPARAAEPKGRCDPDWGCSGLNSPSPAARRDWTRPLGPRVAAPPPASRLPPPPPASRLRLRFRASREGVAFELRGRGRELNYNSQQVVRWRRTGCWENGSPSSLPRLCRASS